MTNTEILRSAFISVHVYTLRFKHFCEKYIPQIQVLFFLSKNDPVTLPISSQQTIHILLHMGSAKWFPRTDFSNWIVEKNKKNYRPLLVSIYGIILINSCTDCLWKSIKSKSNYNTAGWCKSVILWSIMYHFYVLWPSISLAKQGGISKMHMSSSIESYSIFKCIKIVSFNVWARYFVWNFKGTLWHSTKNISPIHWKSRSWLRSENLRAHRFTSFIKVFEMPPNHLIHYQYYTKGGDYQVNTLRPIQDGRHFPDIFKCIFLKENVPISLKISLKFVPRCPINNIPALVQIMAWRRPGDKPLSEPMVMLSTDAYMRHSASMS